MTTRSAIKCSLSQISIDRTEVRLVNGLVYYEPLAANWAIYTAEASIEDSAKTLKIEFIEFSIVQLMHNVLSDGAQKSKHFKILVCWLLQVCPNNCLRQLERCLTLLNVEMYGDAQTAKNAEILTTLFISLVEAILTCDDITAIVQRIDDQKR